MSDIYDVLLNGTDAPVDNADLVARLRNQQTLGRIAQLTGIAGLQKMGPELQSSAQQEAEDVYKTRENAKVRADALAAVREENAQREKDRLAIAEQNSADRAASRALQRSMLNDRLTAGQEKVDDKAAAAGQKIKDQGVTAAAGIDTTIDAVDRLMKHPGLSKIYGTAGMFPNYPGGDAANAKALLDGVVAQEGLQGMANMRQQGGTFGRTTNIEFGALKNAIAPLENQRQGYDQVIATLGAYKKRLLQAKDRIVTAAEAEAAAPSGGHTTVTQGFTNGSALPLSRAVAAPAAPAETAAQRAKRLGL